MSRGWTERLDILEKLLEKERRALARLDFAALTEISEAKLAFAGAAVPPAEGAPPALRSRAARVRSVAEANAALLRSLTDTVAEILCPRIDAGTYDARARIRPRLAPVGMRRI